MKDYVYIGLLDEATHRRILELQKTLQDKYNILEYASKRSPHITMCYGNTLSEDEKSHIESLVGKVSDKFLPASLEFEPELRLIRKNTIQGDSLVLKMLIKDNPILIDIFIALQEIADNYPTPYKGFTGTEFSITIAAWDVPSDFVVPAINVPNRAILKSLQLFITS